MAVVLAVDAGTTSVRSLAVDEQGRVVGLAARELRQHFPRPGWVEHDADEIVRLAEETLVELVDRLAGRSGPVAALGLTNQRETAVAWDARSGTPLARAIVWQDRRTAERCRQLEADGLLPTVRRETGLVLDSYFSATKWEWMIRHGGVPPDAALGTVDSWLALRLTGRHVTEPGNASRTLCFDIREGAWAPDLCEIFSLSPGSLAEVVPSAGRVGTIRSDFAGGRLTGVPLAGMAGDQQAALFGQGCLDPGSVKVTYGTGSFVLMALGEAFPSPVDGLLTTVAWQLGDGESLCYALEGAVFSSGAAVQWLRDGLGIIDSAAEIGPLASTVATSEGVTVVPAFTGLGSPWWDPAARGSIVGLTRGVGRAHLARATIEAMAFQTRDVVETMRTVAGHRVTEIRVDGGASVMDLLCQLQADQCQATTVRAGTTEVTGLGAAFLAGLGAGVWTKDDLSRLVSEESRFEPAVTASRAEAEYRRWSLALERTRSLPAPSDGTAE